MNMLQLMNPDVVQSELAYRAELVERVIRADAAVAALKEQPAGSRSRRPRLSLFRFVFGRPSEA